LPQHQSQATTLRRPGIGPVLLTDLKAATTSQTRSRPPQHSHSQTPASHFQRHLTTTGNRPTTSSPPHRLCTSLLPVSHSQRLPQTTSSFRIKELRSPPPQPTTLPILQPLLQRRTPTIPLPVAMSSRTPHQRTQRRRHSSLRSVASQQVSSIP
jgi:hypothetical protein